MPKCFFFDFVVSVRLTPRLPRHSPCHFFRPLRHIVFKRILSWLHFNSAELERKQGDMQLLTTTLQAISRVYVEIDDIELLVEALEASRLISFSNEDPSSASPGPDREGKLKKRQPEKGKQVSADLSPKGKFVIWNEDDIDVQQPLSRRKAALGLKSLMPSSIFSGVMFALVFFLLYGSAILRTDVFSRIVDGDFD